MMTRILITLCIISLFAGSASAHTGGAHAQTTTIPSTEVSVTPTTTTTTSAVTSPTASPASAPIVSDFSLHPKSPVVWLRFRRFFTFSAKKRSELGLAITNALTEKLKAEQLAGDTVKAASTADALAREMTYLSTAVTVMQQQTDDAQLKTFFDTLLTDQTEKIAQLEALNPVQASELARKIANIRAQALRDVVKTLENDNLSETERAEKLAKVMDKYAKRASKTEAKLARKVAFKAELDDSTESDALESELEDVEEEVLGDAARRLDQDELVVFAGSIEEKGSGYQLLVLQKLFSKVPATATSGIQTALDQMMTEKIAEFKADPLALQEFINDKSGSSKVREQVLEKLKEKADGAVKTQLEQGLEKEKKEREKADEVQKKQEEAKKKAEELKKEEAKKTTEKKKEETRSGKSTATPRVATTNSSDDAEKNTTTSVAIPTATSTPSQDKQTIEIKMKEGRFETTSYRVKRGALLTVKVRNDDSTAHTVTLSNGKTSGSLGEDGETTLSAFTFSDTVTFSATGVTGSGTISLE